jgi:hypothetical protein
VSISDSLKGLLAETFQERAKVSRISPDLRGKTIVLYGGNNVGKTTQASKFKNPIFMPFEKGMNATSGAVVLENTNWADVKRNIKTLSGRKWKELLKKEQITVIWDGFERAGFYCQRYIESKYDAFDIADARNGFGAWQQYEKEIWTEIDKLLSIGYTVVFIGHEEVNKKKGDKIFPKGDSRTVSPIVDNADIVVYIESNGVDEDGNVIPSSGYMYETDDFFGRSRFHYVNPVLEHFTAENLEEAIIEGIKKQLEIDGVEGVDFDEQQQIYNKSEEVTYESLLTDIHELYTALKELEDLEFYEEAVSKHLGEGVRVSEATKRQIEPLICIKDELTDRLEELEEG